MFIDRINFFTAATWAEDQETQISQSVSLAFWKLCPILWNSKKHKKITTSSAESEMNALSDGEQESQWLKFLIEELWKQKLSPTRFSIDNKGLLEKLKTLITQTQQPPQNSTSVVSSQKTSQPQRIFIQITAQFIRTPLEGSPQSNFPSTNCLPPGTIGVPHLVPRAGIKPATSRFTVSSYLVFFQATGSLLVDNFDRLYLSRCSFSWKGVADELVERTRGFKLKSRSSKSDERFRRYHQSKFNLDFCIVYL
ncbi:hypothetical protein PGT21_009016 [Puccinia graminis f. sp. tritici]|uniref:Uncharacterized protein n=1 Tax=Puccinia graminis f. sp. tritici TaxID=56615 RepID=A0A5B0NXP3_PUCGR|nr:hypothetical protein PGTUg99_033491 [Puccinia graminis f. sp. tritici]KAA1094077.1 hypothetical protein PGT21_009016 [Puccinia graminis f. sp. tritici]